MSGGNPFSDDDDDLDKTVVRPISAAPAQVAPVQVTPVQSPSFQSPSFQSTPVTPAPRPIPPGAAQTTPFPVPGAAPVTPPVTPLRGAPTIAPPAATATPDAALLRDPSLLAGSSISRLVDAATPTLALIVAVRDLEDHPDPEGLLDKAIAEIRNFETNALSAGYAAEPIRLARYALCATMDDVVLATPWGGRTVWNSRGLVTTIHRETMSGERFYSVLDTLSAKPDEHRDELHLFYICLSLGFEGKYRIMPRGATELNRVRDRLYRLLTAGVEPATAPFAPAAIAHAANRRAPGGVIPIWVPLLIALAVLGVAYNVQSSGFEDRIATVRTEARPLASVIDRIDVTAPEPEPEPVWEPEPPVPVEMPVDRITAFLAPEIAASEVEVSTLTNAVMVRVLIPDQFVSGGTTASDPLAELLGRIGAALAVEQGDIAVLGNTDSVPMRPNAQFADNTALSQVRAQAALDLLMANVAPTRQGSATGLGPDAPIADNATPEGRAQNRRIEVLLLSPGTDPASVLQQIGGGLR